LRRSSQRYSGVSRQRSIPLGSKATYEHIEIKISLGGGSPPMQQDQNPVDQEARQSKTKEYQ